MTFRSKSISTAMSVNLFATASTSQGAHVSADPTVLAPSFLSTQTKQVHTLESDSDAEETSAQSSPEHVPKAQLNATDTATPSGTLDADQQDLQQLKERDCNEETSYSPSDASCRASGNAVAAAEPARDVSEFRYQHALPETQHGSQPCNHMVSSAPQAYAGSAAVPQDPYSDTPFKDAALRPMSVELSRAGMSSALQIFFVK
jgi:hypothetical protein